MLIKCKECGKQISDKATACPDCGAPVANASKTTLIELSSKELKKKELLWTLTFIISAVLIPATAIMGMAMRPNNQEPSTLFWSIITIEVLLAVISFIAIIVVKVQSWWRHG